MSVSETLAPGAAVAQLVKAVSHCGVLVRAASPPGPLVRLLYWSTPGKGPLAHAAKHSAHDGPVAPPSLGTAAPPFTSMASVTLPLLVTVYDGVVHSPLGKPIAVAVELPPVQPP